MIYTTYKQYSILHVLEKRIRTHKIFDGWEILYHSLYFNDATIFWFLFYINLLDHVNIFSLFVPCTQHDEDRTCRSPAEAGCVSAASPHPDVWSFPCSDQINILSYGRRSTYVLYKCNRWSLTWLQGHIQPRSSWTHPDDGDQVETNHGSDSQSCPWWRLQTG